MSLLLRSGRSFAATVAIFLSLSTPTGWADAQADTIAELRAQLVALTARLETLEAQQQQTHVAVQANSIEVAETKTLSQSAIASSKVSPAKSAESRLKYGADFRYRFESFNIEDTPDRHRNRIRARVDVKATVSDEMLLGFALASGSNDPISSNQTLGDNDSSKQVNIDQAYIRFQPTGRHTDLYAGKFKNPLYRAGGNGLLWDGDLRPEGLAAKFSRNDVFVNALATWITESKAGDDILLLGTQLGIKTSVFDSASLVAGLGYYEYTGIQGSAEYIPEKPRGNRVTDQGRYLSGFDLLEGFAELKFPTSFGKASVYADYVKNLGADDYDTGYTLGAKIGLSDWSFGWAYENIEADAVYAQLTDSDFGGGGTDSEGHRFSASYAISKKIKLGGTVFLNDRNVDFGNEQDYQRFMLDLSVKY
jgi:hypothetical protein